MPAPLVLVLALLVAACCGAPPAPPPLVPTTGYVTTPDGVRLWYRAIGGGPETVIVPNALFHGDRLDSLAGPTRRLVLYDPRGRGRSDAVGPDRISLERQIADVEAIRQAVGADSIALIGWSGTGMELFAYTLRHQDRVTRLVQRAPVAPRFTPYADSMGASRQARTNEWPDRIGAYFSVLLGSLGEWDWRPDRARVTVPRLVIHGALDNPPLAGNREWVDGQPNAGLVVIRGAGHWPHYERPAETLAAIRRFLDGET